MKGLLLIFTYSAAVITSPIENHKCDSGYITMCHNNYQIADFTLERQRNYPWTVDKDKIDESCRTLEDARDCLNYTLENCLGDDKIPLDIDDLRSTLNSTSKHEEELCTEGHPVREAHVKHTECIKSNASKELVEKHCLNSTRLFVQKAIPEERSKPFNFSIPDDAKVVCCSANYALECMENLVFSSCGETTTNYFMETYIDYVPQMPCDEDWTYGSDECAAVIPQSLVKELGLDVGTAISSMISLIMGSFLFVQYAT